MDASASKEVSIRKISIKKENLNDDIKDFAQTAMNELLGWYGYDNSTEDLKLPKSCRSHSGSTSSGLSPKSTEGCGWCGKTVDETSGLTSSSATFCSELCFSQSRRASFKKNRTCDWCKHVRHTVSYVDFQDGASQLQFCSDKCLNQYKMHIFCRETRAHLELHPHLHTDDATNGSTLITPDLWLKNCRSPELQPPSPDASSKTPEKNVQTSPLPLISIAHPSKLMEPADHRKNRFKSQRKSRKKIPATVTCSSFQKILPCDIPQDLRIRHSPTEFEHRIEQVCQRKTPESEFVPVDPPKEAREPRVPTPLCNTVNQPPPEPQVRKTFNSLLPPPTLIVPYPIILPLPIPIPIPIPIPVRKEETGSVVEKKDSSSQTEEVKDEKAEKDKDCVAVEKEKEAKPPGRPLRRRKRACEPIGKLVIKTRKVITNSN